MEEKNNSLITSKQAKSNNYLMPGSIIIAAILIVGAIFISQRPSFSQYKSAQSDAAKEKVSQPEEITVKGVNIDFEGFPTMGNPEAKVVMVEYSDFACPFCSRFWQETLSLIKKDYVDTGKILFVYKDFIVVGGDMGAQAAHCAQEQGKFWEYHDKLFSRTAEDRSRWADSEVHRGYARELGLNEELLIKCFEERRYQEKVTLSTQEATRNGGQGTPFFLINGEPVFGAQPYSNFQKVLDAALQKN